MNTDGPCQYRGTTVQQTNHRDVDGDAPDNDPIVFERTYTFDPSQVFTQETLEDMRARLALTEHDMTIQQFARILDEKMPVHLTLAIAADGFRYVKDGDDGNRDWAKDDANHGPHYSVRFHEFASPAKAVILDHITDSKVTRSSNAELFLRYQMNIDDNEAINGVGYTEAIDATDIYYCVLPTRKQVLALHHKWYVLPATEDDSH